MAVSAVLLILAVVLFGLAAYLTTAIETKLIAVGLACIALAMYLR